jgi:hypothetical protein
MTPGEMTDEGLIVTMFLMFVGAGSAGTSGGIKAGTFALLVLVVRAELRGSRDVVVFGRRIAEAVQRQAITVVLLAGVGGGGGDLRPVVGDRPAPGRRGVRGGVGLRHRRACPPASAPCCPRPVS